MWIWVWVWVLCCCWCRCWCVQYTSAGQGRGALLWLNVLLSECRACKAMAKDVLARDYAVEASGLLSRRIIIEMQLSWACCGVRR